MQMKKEKCIETTNLTIKGNLVTWKGTMIQLDNISCISTENMAEKAFPFISLLPLIIGILLHEYVVVMLLLIAASLAWIYLWGKKNDDLQSMKLLNILLNSGDTFQLVFTDLSFLDKVEKVFETILIDGNSKNQDISIDIKGCTISGNAQLLSNLKVGDE